MTTVHESTTSSFLAATSEVLSGIATGSTHGYWYAKNLCNKWLFKPFQRLAGFSTNDDDKSAESSPKELQVVGVGYGRTGTYSLTLALDELGHKTLHTQHMYETPEILDMWNREIFTPSIESGNADLGHPDFDLIASKGFTATADLPMSLYFEQLVSRMRLDEAAHIFHMTAPPIGEMLRRRPVESRQHIMAVSQPFNDGRIESFPVRQTFDPFAHWSKGQYESSGGILIMQDIQCLYLREEAAATFRVILHIQLRIDIVIAASLQQRFVRRV